MTARAASYLFNVKTNMSLISRFGTYDKPTAAVAMQWNPEKERLEASILLVGYENPFDIEEADRLSELLDQLITRGDELDMQGAPSNMPSNYRNPQYCHFIGGFAGFSYGTAIRLTQPNMQLTMAQAAQLLEDLRKCITLSLAMVKATARQFCYSINGKLIERVLDTESLTCRKAEQSRATKNAHRRQRLDCIAH